MMHAQPQNPLCQMESLQGMAHGAKIVDYLVMVVHRIELFSSRRLRFVMRSFARQGSAQTEPSLNSPATALSPGDLVRVKTKEEIVGTLDPWYELKRCGFMDEMEIYCGTTQRVLKRVERFIDERDFRVKRSKGIVLLEGVICEGTEIFGKCDRSCYFFWREEWVEKLATEE